LGAFVGTRLRCSQSLLLWVVRVLGGAQVAQQPALLVLVSAAAPPRVAAAVVVVLAVAVAFISVMVIRGRGHVPAASPLPGAMHSGVVMKTGMCMADVRKALHKNRPNVRVRTRSFRASSIWYLKPIHDVIDIVQV
jgi:hypothetical protein